RIDRGLARPRGRRRRALGLGRIGILALPIIGLVGRRGGVRRLVGRPVRPALVARIGLIARIGLVARIALVAGITRRAGRVARLRLRRLRVAGGAAAPIGITVAVLSRGSCRERAG